MPFIGGLEPFYAFPYRAQFPSLRQFFLHDRDKARRFRNGGCKVRISRALVWRYRRFGTGDAPLEDFRAIFGRISLDTGKTVPKSGSMMVH
jgi:hypothetical protein